MTLVVSLRTFANASDVPDVALVDAAQEYAAEPRAAGDSSDRPPAGRLPVVLGSYPERIGIFHDRRISSPPSHHLSVGRFGKSYARRLASSIRGKALAAASAEKPDSVLATLERYRTVLLADAVRETAELVASAILQRRMKLNRIVGSELKVLCDAMIRDCEPVAVGLFGSPRVKLKLVK